MSPGDQVTIDAPWEPQHRRAELVRRAPVVWRLGLACSGWIVRFLDTRATSTFRDEEITLTDAVTLLGETHDG